MSERDWSAVTVDELEAVPWRGTDLVWRPLRAALGLHAFGAGAYTADRIGQTVVEPHVEAGEGRDHEELYVVLAGRATFTLDGATLDAPAGTLVRVGAAVHRAAVAAEAPTVVLAFGREPDFAVAGSEWTERARPLMRSDPARARALLEEGLRELPDSAGVRYGLALLAAHEGREEEARAWLADTLAREPRVRPDAEREPALAPLLR